jgi:hypothetical protein
VREHLGPQLGHGIVVLASALGGVAGRWGRASLLAPSRDAILRFPTRMAAPDFTALTAQVDFTGCAAYPAAPNFSVPASHGN